LQIRYNMPDEKIIILSTRPLEKALIAKASAENIEIDVTSFIRTEGIRNNFLKKRITEIFNESSPVIFTSVNAAEAVAGYLETNEPKWKIYSLGSATKNMIRHHFPFSEIIGEAENASGLADEILKNKEKNVIFFCGDLRRDELPDKLAGQQIAVEEVTVYSTIASAEKIEKVYDGILFFSPSAVESFFSFNNISESTILFAIGATTSRSIRRFTNNKIIESDYPGKNNLVEKSILYFATSNHTNEHIKK
jgi:uroporphyrinogen-III synthase